jgi:hypothetical protein
MTGVIGDVLAPHDGVQAMAVFGASDDRRGEKA